MTNRDKTYKFIISGGGTGGHIFPALSIADTIRELLPHSEILFVGAKGKMEMEKVPAAGYNIKALWISGFNRSRKLKNISIPFKILSSLYKSNIILNKFKPDAVIGTGGFASAPILYAAQKKGILTFIQEQNSFPGITNKFLAKKANKIYTAYDNLERFFDNNKSKIVNTGNPIRKSLSNKKISKENALQNFNFNPDKKTIFVVGGSLGAMPVNIAIEKNLNKIKNNDWQLIWQTGNNHFEKFKKYDSKNIRVLPFIKNINEAYAASDLIISRAGAGSISELAIVGKPVILIPSPYVAEDHQTKNAQALAEKKAAILIKEKDLNNNLFENIEKILTNNILSKKYAENIKKIAKPNATKNIVEDILIQIEEKK